MNNPSRFDTSVNLRAIDVEPPIADEVLLVEDSPVGAEEAVLGKSAPTIIPAYVERLALCLRVGVVAFTKGELQNVCWDQEVGCKDTLDVALADKTGVGRLGEYWVINACCPRNGFR